MSKPTAIDRIGAILESMREPNQLIINNVLDIVRDEQRRRAPVIRDPEAIALRKTALLEEMVIDALTHHKIHGEVHRLEAVMNEKSSSIRKASSDEARVVAARDIEQTGLEWRAAMLDERKIIAKRKGSLIEMTTLEMEGPIEKDVYRAVMIDADLVLLLNTKGEGWIRLRDITSMGHTTEGFLFVISGETRMELMTRADYDMIRDAWIEAHTTVVEES